MNAELTQLAKSGWAVVDVAVNDHEAEPEDAEEADELDALMYLTRDGPRVWVNPDFDPEVTRDEALAALQEELGKEPYHELIINGCQRYQEPWYGTVEPWCFALAALGSKTLRRFVVDSYDSITRQASVHCGDVTGIFRACPALSSAVIIGCAEIKSLAHERLEDLILMADPLDSGTIRAVLRGACPRLARVALGLAYEGAPAAQADEALIAAFSESNLPALTELYIAYPTDGVVILDGIVSSPAFANLRVLSIEGDVFEDEERGLAILEKHRQELSKLERLHLPIEDVMSRTDDELVAMIPSLRPEDDGFSWDGMPPS